MRECSRIFFALLFFVFGFAGSGMCGIGSHDTRRVVDWSEEKYRPFVRLDNGVNLCTAQFIAQNLILSAGHCTGRGYKYRVTNYNGEEFDVKLLKSKDTRNGNDWAIFLVADPKYYSNDFFTPTKPTGTRDVINAGWGWMRVLNDTEFGDIKKIVQNISAQDSKNFSQELKSKMAYASLVPLLDVNDNLKASVCQVDWGADCEILSGDSRYSSCKNHDIIRTTCSTCKGNSGGGYIDVNNNLYGIVSFGSKESESFSEDANFNYAASTKQFYDVFQRLQKNNPTTGTGTPKDEDGQDIETGDEYISDADSAAITADVLRRDIEIIDANLKQQIPKAKAGELSDRELLGLLDKLVDREVKSERLEQLQKKYDSARETEQSVANRALTAVTTAATGLGTMEALRGLAEQQADKKADADMDAYLATMRCSYADGKSVKAGLEPIELPGGNDENLMKYRNEYIVLATSLKNRKESLGMKPGIESELILDKADIGLYDQENVGITEGKYSSLYRAKMQNSETDKTEIEEESQKSANRLKYGAIAAGAGVAVGVIGNSAINGKLNELIKEAKGNMSDNRTNRNTINAFKDGLKSAGLTDVDKLDFSNLDLSGMQDIIGKIDFSNMADGLKGKSATEVLNTSNKTSFISSLSNILGDKNVALFAEE